MQQQSLIQAHVDVALCSGVNLAAGSSRWWLDLVFKVFPVAGMAVSPFQTQRGQHWFRDISSLISTIYWNWKTRKQEQHISVFWCKVHWFHSKIHEPLKYKTSNKKEQHMTSGQ